MMKIYSKPTSKFVTINAGTIMEPASVVSGVRIQPTGDEPLF